MSGGQYPLCSSRAAVAALKRLGFVEAHCRGSHQTMTRPRESGSGTDVVVILLGKKQIPRGTLNTELKRVGITPDEFRRALR